MEVGDDEVGIRDVDVQSEGGEKESGHAADGEEPDETQDVEHRRHPGDGRLVERRGPVEDFDG